nr:S8 family peptidase [candidate division Zixibacteria bacterium]
MDKCKIWVFFTDKGFPDEAGRKSAIANLADRYTRRSLERRIRRSDNPEIFSFADIPVNQDYVSQLSAAGFKVIYQSRWLNAVSGMADKATIESLAALSFVCKIQPVAVARRIPIPDGDIKDISIPPETKKPSDILPDSVRDWYGYSYTQLNMVNIPLMHQLGYTGEGILIGIFDTGFDLDHPAFSHLNICDRCKYDFVFDDTSVGDIDNSPAAPAHGTATLSIIGGKEDSVFVGGAYEASFLVAKTERVEEEIEAEEDYWVAAAEWADSLGADVISSSLGYFDWYTYEDLDGKTALVTIAAEQAAANGIVVVNSAGNENLNAWHYVTPPADGPSVIAVGAVNSLGIIASFSSAGPTYDGRVKPDVVAMGVNVYKADYQTGSYGTGSGTSYACPATAAAAALLLEVHPDWSPLDLKDAMIHSANRYNTPDTLYGYGLYNTFKAADLLHFEPVSPIRLAVGDTLDITLTVSGLEDSTSIVISATNLPATAEFTDNGDRTARLFYIGNEDDVGSRIIHLTGAAGSAVATYDLTLTVLIQNDIIAGPNPFSDSLTIFLGTGNNNLQEIAIYSVNGEKVWDNYSDTYNEVTGSVVWQGVNNDGSRVASGVYLVLVKTDRMVKRIKVFRK